MKKYLINYADKSHFHAQKINSYTGIHIAGFDEVIEYSIADIDENFKAKNYHILNQRRGAGYWIWKPYIILKTLKNIANEDILFYSDSGVEFISSIDPLINICDTETEGLLVFNMEPIERNKEVLQTKKDTFVLMDCIGEKYTETHPRIGSFSMWRRNDFTIKLAEEWLEYCQDERIVTDLPNQCGIAEDIRHENHRHDQSVFSLLTKKYDIKSYIDISQWGNAFRNLENRYGQIVNHTRYNG